MPPGGVPKHSLLSKCLFQLDDEPYHYHEEWVEITKHPKRCKRLFRVEKGRCISFHLFIFHGLKGDVLSPIGSREIRYPGLSPRQMSPVQLRSCKNGIAVSLPETNSLHLKNRPQKETIVFQPSIFRCFCCWFRGVG